MKSMGIPHGSNRLGRFVVLVGPDGVGKTAVARALLAHHQGPAAYFHFLPPLRGPLARSPGPESTPPPKPGARGSAVLGWLRILRNAARCWIGYIRTVRPALQHTSLIVGDRWLYGYVAQPNTLRFYG